MNKSWVRLMMGAGLSCSLVLAAGNASAESAESRAKNDYINYCAACHGADGTGNGPMAEELKTPPIDLTVLSKKNDGRFPYRMVGLLMDGSRETGKRTTHGSTDMPVWGDVFRREGGISDKKYSNASVKILNIVTHINSIQKK